MEHNKYIYPHVIYRKLYFCFIYFVANLVSPNMPKKNIDLYILKNSPSPSSFHRKKLT